MRQVIWGVNGLLVVLIVLTFILTPAQDADTFLVEVSASELFQDSGIEVYEGDSVEVSYVSGQWFLCPRGCSLVVGADGWVTQDTGEPREDSDNWATNYMPGCPAGALMAQVMDAQVIPQEGYCVGSSHLLEIASDGVLYFGINDKTIGDNGGSIQIQVLVR